MNDLTYLKAIVLGFVQGATEFLPISSSAHLAVSQQMMGLDPSSPPILLFDGFSHIGTVIAVIIVFRRDIVAYARRLLAETTPGWTKRRYAWRFAVLGIFASIPTAVIGLTFKDWFEESFRSDWHNGGGLIVTGLLLAATMQFRRGKIGWGRFKLGHAVLIGIAQGAAIQPGISRSGATIAAAVMLGIRRRWAGEFSFFIAVSAILGAAAIKLKDTFELPTEQFAAVPWGPLFAGGAVALVVGTVSLAWLMHVVRRAKLHWFAVYCFVVGGLILAGVV